MYFLLLIILFLFNGNNNYKSLQADNYYLKILKLLAPQIIKNSNDIIHWNFFKDFYQIVYNYPNFLGYGMALNYFELLKETKKKNLTEQIINGFLNQEFVNIIGEIIINKIMIFDNFNEAHERQETIQKKQIFYSQCLSVFLDNYLEEILNFDEFFQEIEKIQNKYNKEDHIYLYCSIIKNQLNDLQKIYYDVIKGESLINFRYECIFFNIIQLLFNGNTSSLMFYKTSYPSRFNYIILKKYFYQNNFNKPYKYSGRYVLTQVYEKQPIKDLNLKDIIIKDLSLVNIKNNQQFKSLFLKNFANCDVYLQNIYILYFFLKKFESYGNHHKKNQYDQYIFWLLCKYYNSYFYKQWINKLKEEEEKKQQG